MLEPFALLREIRNMSPLEALCADSLAASLSLTRPSPRRNATSLPPLPTIKGEAPTSLWEGNEMSFEVRLGERTLKVPDAQTGLAQELDSSGDAGRPGRGDRIVDQRDL